MYTVKEIYTTLQGEGAQTGRAAVFLRFAGCNLWNGLERDRAVAACRFCDTDFVGADGPGGGKFAEAGALADAVAKAWSDIVGSYPSSCPSPARGEGTLFPPLPLRERGRGEGWANSATPYVVCTGGEPLLQLDEPLIEALHAGGFEIAIETNGTKPAPPGIDWICVSPKAGAPLVLTSGDELKLVFPQGGAEPARFERLDFRHFFLQPMDGPSARANTLAAAQYCLKHPRWRLSLQTHKLIGLP
ncbi:MAG: 7-carboxy-7-deazaguanine synthase QueE [Rhodomicrobium sp.]